jgi:hypothetical protein
MILTVRTTTASSVSIGGRVGTLPGNKTVSFELSVTEMDELRSKLTSLVTRGLVEYTVTPNNVSGDDDLEFATIDYVNDSGGGGPVGPIDSLETTNVDAGAELSGDGNDITITAGDVTGSNDEGLYTGGDVVIKAGTGTDTSTSEFTFIAEGRGGDVVIEGGEGVSNLSNFSGGNVHIRAGNYLGSAYGTVFVDGAIRLATVNGTISSGRTVISPYQGVPWSHNGTLTRKIDVRSITGNGSAIASATSSDQILALNTTLGSAHYRVFPDGYLYEPITFKKVSSDTNPIFFSTVTGAAATINGVLCRANVDPPYQLPGSNATNFPSWTLFTDGTNHWIIVHTYPA